ncbi:MAG TPA: histidine kinase [Variovorax sp.]|nr:histidine kinase [Variovorax sp.]
MDQSDNLNADREFETGVVSDAQMAARMRLVLAVAAMLAACVDAGFGHPLGEPAWVAFGGYLLYATAVWALLQHRQSAPAALQGRLAHWLDVAWFTAIVALCDGAQSLYFLFYFFAILCAAFRWGYEEGARVTVVSVASFAACTLLASQHNDVGRLLMRITFMLALGHMIVYWGGSKLAFQRRLALLREVCRMSNPRFGAGAALDRLLRRTLDFFHAHHVLLLMRNTASGAWIMRSLAPGGEGCSSDEVRVEHLDAPAAARWNSFVPAQATLVNRLAWLGWRRPGIRYDAAQGRWTRCDSDAAQRCNALADMLDASSLICAPLPAQCERGLIIVCTREGHFRKSDALFLEHLAGQVMPMVQNVDALDRLAGEAASNERHKLALDLHDTAIQPYIGLKLGLGALCSKASADNPLRGDLEGLARMCEQVITDLRRFARAVKRPAAEPAAARRIAPQLREQANQLQRQWGVDVDIEVDDGLRVGERLGAAVLQVVREGVTNIGKHARAPKSRVRVRRADERIQIQIENPTGDEPPQVAFQPASITERARVLGGSAQVQQDEQGKTAVLVQIPV